MKISLPFIFSIFIASFLSASLVLSFAFAEEVSEDSVEPTTEESRNTETRTTVNGERQQNMENMRTNVEASQGERQAALQKRAQERIINLAANMSNRMEAAIRRFENVTRRIDSRIAKLNDANYDTSTAAAYVLEAKTDIANTKQTLSSIDRDVVNAITSNDPRANWQRVRQIYSTAREQLQSAHNNLKLAVDALKTASRINEQSFIEEAE